MSEKNPEGYPAFFTASTTASHNSSDVRGCFEDALTTTGHPSLNGSIRSGPTTPIPHGKFVEGKFTATPRGTRRDRTLIDLSSAIEMDGNSLFLLRAASAWRRN